MAVGLAAFAAMPVADVVHVVITVLSLAARALGAATARAATVATCPSAAIAASAALVVAPPALEAAAVARRVTALPTTPPTASAAIAEEVDERVDVDRPWHRKRGHAAARLLLGRVVASQKGSCGRHPQQRTRVRAFAPLAAMPRRLANAQYGGEDRHAAAADEGRGSRCGRQRMAPRGSWVGPQGLPASARRRQHPRIAEQSGAAPRATRAATTERGNTKRSTPTGARP